MRRNKRKNKKKRKSNHSGASGDKRQRLLSDDSEFGETEESETLPDVFDGKTKEELTEILSQVYAERTKLTKQCLANIGGERVIQEDGTFTFKGGFNIGPFSQAKAAAATGLTQSTISKNIISEIISTIKTGPYKGQKAMFISVPTGMVKIKMHGIYIYIMEKINNNKNSDVKHVNKKPKLIATIDGFTEPLLSWNLREAAKKYHFTEKQIEDSIDEKEQLLIVKSKQVYDGTSKYPNLAGCKVRFHWEYTNPVSEIDKKKVKAMDKPAMHKLAFQICKCMIEKGMFASKNVRDDNGGFIENGFVFRNHGGLFAPSMDRIIDNAIGFHCIHYPNIDDAFENIKIVALFTNVLWKATKVEHQKKVTDFENKPEDQRQQEFKNVLEISRKATHKRKARRSRHTPLYSHANRTWRDDDDCKVVFPDTLTEKGYKAYWQHLLGLLEKQEGLCAVAKIPMSLESGPWKMSCDAIDPRKGHVPGNLRLVCVTNNTTDMSKKNPNPNDPTLTSLTTEIYDKYWGIVRR